MSRQDLKGRRSLRMHLVLALFIVLTIVFASLNIYQYLRAPTYGTPGPSYSDATRGMVVRNGTLFDVASINTTFRFPNGTIASIANGTTLTLRDVSFTFVLTYFNMTRGAFRFTVTSLAHGWNETLTIASPATPQPQKEEVYTSHSNPRAGLAVTYHSPVVQLLVGVSSAEVAIPSSATENCHQEKSNGVYIRAIQDGSEARIQGGEVKASPTTLCNGVETVTAILLQATTNSSGLVHFEGFYGSYYKLTVAYSGETYNYTAPMKTNETTFLTIHLPSGIFETSYQ
jgi:hypothetical protein